MRHYLVAILFFVLGACAQTGQVFYTGGVDFHYDQLFGPFDGDFSVEGSIDTTNWIPTLEEGLGGIIASTDTTSAQQLLSIAAKRIIDTDTTWHVFGILYRSPSPIVVGPVPNAASTVNLFLLWNLDSLALPTELPDSLDLMQILGALVAERKFVGTASSGMNITSMDETSIDFSFGGTMIDIDNPFTIVTVSNGAAHMEGFPLNTVEPVPATRPREAVTLSPNPFNPTTQVSFKLEQAGQVDLEVFDLAGRMVERTSVGWRPAGLAQVEWHAGNHPTGPYLISVTQEGTPVGSARAMLVK